LKCLFVSFKLEHLSGAKRVKRTSSPIATNLYINSSDENSESDDDDDDERDSSLNSTTILSNTVLTCPICGSTYHRLGHLLRHAKRKHHLDLSNYNQSNTFDILPTSNIERNNSNEQTDTIHSNQQQSKSNKLIY
jgi:hypothetical protein